MEDRHLAFTIDQGRCNPCGVCGDIRPRLIPDTAACQRVPEIGKLLGLADNREVHASITMGHPEYKFKRIPTRKLAEITFL